MTAQYCHSQNFKMTTQGTFEIAWSQIKTLQIVVRSLHFNLKTVY